MAETRLLDPERWPRAAHYRHFTEYPCAVSLTDEIDVTALREACREMDVATPMWLSKNLSEFERFGLTAFVADNFVEHIAFDRMEIEFIDDDDKKKRSADPRNVF